MFRKVRTLFTKHKEILDNEWDQEAVQLRPFRKLVIAEKVFVGLNLLRKRKFGNYNSHSLLTLHFLMSKLFFLKIHKRRFIIQFKTWLFNCCFWIIFQFIIETNVIWIGDSSFDKVNVYTKWGQNQLTYMWYTDT